MKSANDGLATGLAFAGALPFLALVAILVLRLDVPVPAAADLRSYTLVIAAFMAGTAWGYALPQADGRLYLLLSNVLALAAFAADRVRQPRLGLGADIVIFIALLLLDVMARRGGYIRAEYLRLRLGVTALVVAALAVAWVAV